MSQPGSLKGSVNKSKTKYVPLFSQDGQQEVVLLPGRNRCSCQASKHALINNCLNCGRIVCQQEGSGPCFTCKILVCTKEEQEVLNRNSKTSAKLLQKLMGDSENVSRPNYSSDEKLAAAIEHKNKLLDYDKTVSRRTKVIDDQSDFFELDSNKWLSKDQKKKIKDKKKEIMDAVQGSRRNKTFGFDFAGRQIIEEKPNLDFNLEQYLNDEVLKNDDAIFDTPNVLPCDDIHGFEPEYLGLDFPKVHRRHLADLGMGMVKLNLMRIQDRELQEMSDDGMCLSLHQPYASLIVAGIKKHEGRIWYTGYRGRIWIHAASKVPTKKEIDEVESSYRIFVGNCTFPSSYPSGCLLGCIDLVECLPQEEYREKFPEGESADPYVFICENPMELMIKFPMKGKHKIYKMDGKIHQAAKKTLKN